MKYNAKCFKLTGKTYISVDVDAFEILAYSVQGWLMYKLKYK
jgi:hypothetical protein